MSADDETSWTTTGEEIVLDGRVRMAARDVLLPDGSRIRYVLNLGTFAVASLLVVDGEVLLARQYRYPIDQWIHDLPGGGGNEGEEPVAAAAREVEEELGLVPTDLRPLHTFFANPGLSTWPVHLFFGTRVRPGTPHTADATEQVRLARMPLAELDARIAQGGIVDPSLLIARTMAGLKGFLPALGGAGSTQ